MPDPKQNAEFFDLLAKALLRSWIFGFAVLYTWVGIIFLAKDRFYGLLGNLFGLSHHELGLTNYCGIVLLKLLLIVFFVIPWLAIRLVLRRRRE